MIRFRFVIAIIILTGLLPAAVTAATRTPAVAGSFYPADSTALAKMVSGHLAGVKNLPDIDGRLVALIVPHAGLIYSGQIAACSYKLLEGSRVGKVVLCGPSHRFGFEGISVYGPAVVWKTPLGEIACDDQLCQQLLDFDSDIKIIEQAHRAEHCLEVQLPYLQTVLDECHIVPMVVGYPNPGTIKTAADALTALDTDEHTVMVASTDWQHFRPASTGWKLDSVGLDCIQRLDADALEAHLLRDSKTEACGGAATVAVMKAAIAKGANRVKILKYGDSGDITGDKSNVVGYAAAVLYRSGDTQSGGRTPSSEKAQFELTDAQKHTLLKIARASIENYLARKPMPEFDVSGNLTEPGAAFVTLTKEGRLRGCIGYTMAFQPLHKTVTECAVKAAVEDPRFPPVTSGELPDLHIEISVLTPLEPVSNLNEIEVGRDGLMITMGRQRGLLLPQVATDYGWTRDEFLEQTCRKAGLPMDAYKSPKAIIERFQAIIFEEEK